MDAQDLTLLIFVFWGGAGRDGRNLTENSIIGPLGRNLAQVLSITAKDKREEGRRKISPSWPGSGTSHCFLRLASNHCLNT